MYLRKLPVLLLAVITLGLWSTEVYANSGGAKFLFSGNERGLENEKDSLDKNKNVPYMTYKDQSSVSLSTGSTGLGLSYARNFHKSFNVMLRASRLQVNYNNISIKEGDQELEATAELQSSNADLLLEVLPFPQSSFHVNVGLSYFFDLGSSGSGRYKGEVSYGDILLDSDAIGKVDFAVNWNEFAPYIGIGFGRAIPKNRFGFGFDLGGYYVGSPDVTIDATNLLSDNDQNEPVLEDNLQSYTWWPLLNFKLSYKL